MGLDGFYAITLMFSRLEASGKLAASLGLRLEASGQLAASMGLDWFYAMKPMFGNLEAAGDSGLYNTKSKVTEASMTSKSPGQARAGAA